MMQTPGPGRTLFQFVRFWSRRWTATGQEVDADRGRDVMVVEAVSTYPGGATVNQIAEELGLDQSGASRLASAAERRQYLRKTTSARDGRQRLLIVTDAGHDLVRAAHAWQEQVFADLTADWTPQEIEEFRRLMLRLVSRRQAPRIDDSSDGGHNHGATNE